MLIYSVGSIGFDEYRSKEFPRTFGIGWMEAEAKSWLSQWEYDEDGYPNGRHNRKLSHGINRGWTNLMWLPWASVKGSMQTACENSGCPYGVGQVIGAMIASSLWSMHEEEWAGNHDVEGHYIPSSSGAWREGQVIVTVDGYSAGRLSGEVTGVGYVMRYQSEIWWADIAAESDSGVPLYVQCGGIGSGIYQGSERDGERLRVSDGTWTFDGIWYEVSGSAPEFRSRVYRDLSVSYGGRVVSVSGWGYIPQGRSGIGLLDPEGGWTWKPSGLVCNVGY